MRYFHTSNIFDKKKSYFSLNYFFKLFIRFIYLLFAEALKSTRSFDIRSRRLLREQIT